MHYCATHTQSVGVRRLESVTSCAIRISLSFAVCKCLGHHLVARFVQGWHRTVRTLLPCPNLSQHYQLVKTFSARDPVKLVVLTRRSTAGLQDAQADLHKRLVSTVTADLRRRKAQSEDAKDQGSDERAFQGVAPSPFSRFFPPLLLAVGLMGRRDGRPDMLDQFRSSTILCRNASNADSVRRSSSTASSGPRLANTFLACSAILCMSSRTCS